MLVGPTFALSYCFFFFFILSFSAKRPSRIVANQFGRSLVISVLTNITIFYIDFNWPVPRCWLTIHDIWINTCLTPSISTKVYFLVHIFCLSQIHCLSQILSYSLFESPTASWHHAKGYQYISYFFETMHRFYKLILLFDIKCVYIGPRLGLAVI